MTTPALTYRFVTARTLALVRDLELAARTAVDGVMLGRHTSRRSGAGLEFSQYRSYQPGDDLRRLDWKLFGRSDRYFVREAESETSITVRLLLDATGSMAHEEDGVTKLDYARFLAAALALLAHRQGDAIGLYVLGDEISAMRPRRDLRHLHSLLHRLERLTPQGAWPEWPAIERAIAPDATRGITVIIGDCHQRSGEIEAAVRRLSGARHEVVCFQILGDLERRFEYHGAVTFEDFETGQRVDLDTDAARTIAGSRFEEQLREFRQNLEERGAALVSCMLSQPFEDPLREYLAQRDRLA